MRKLTIFDIMSSSTSSTTKKGTASGTKNWTQKELDLLLDCVEAESPCGAKQWELVAMGMFTEGKYVRNAKSCRLKFDKLWSTEKPTGSADPPRHIIRAQQIKDKIEIVETMGHVNQNDSDD